MMSLYIKQSHLVTRAAHIAFLFPFCILLLTDIRIKIRAIVFLTSVMRCSTNDELGKKKCTISTRKPLLAMISCLLELLTHHDGLLVHPLV